MQKVSLQHCLAGYELLTVKPRRKWHYPMPGYRDNVAVFIYNYRRFPNKRVVLFCDTRVRVFRRWYYFATRCSLEDCNRRFVLTCTLLQAPTDPADTDMFLRNVLSSYQTIRCHNREP